MLMALTLLVAALASWTSADSEVPPVTVTIYYETLSPESAAFLVGQFYPAYSRLKEYVNADLVPYGLATHRKYDHDNFEFTCDHGPAECEGNMIHACALNYLNKAVGYVRCTLDVDSGARFQWGKCARGLGLDYSTVEGCVGGRAGPALLAAMGHRTKRLRPPLTAVPTVVFDNRPDQTEQGLATLDFESALCAHIARRGATPPGCKIGSRGRSLAGGGSTAGATALASQATFVLLPIAVWLAQ